MNRTSFILIAGLAFLFPTPCFGQGAGQAISHSPPIPHPSLENVGKVVRTHLEEERRRFEAIFKSGPADSSAHVAQAYSRMARVYHAYQFQEAALACYLNLERRRPGIYPCLYTIGRIHHSQGRFEPALHFLTKSKTIADRLDDTPAAVKVAMDCLIGDAALKQGRLPEAMKAFENAVDQDPECAYAWHGMGVAHSIESRTNAAIGCLERALELQPHASAGRALLIREYRRAGHNERANEMLAALDGNPRTIPFAFQDPIIEQDVTPLNRSARAMLSRALRARNQGRLQHSIDLFKEAIEQDPRFTLAKANLAGVLLTLHRFTEAEMLARQVLADRPDDASFRDLLGTSLFRQRKFDGALRAFQRAGELEPDQGNHWYRTGGVLSWQGKPREALAMFDKAAQLDHTSVEARIGAAIMQARLEQLPEAKERLARCIEQFPHSVQAKMNWVRILSADPDSTPVEHATALRLALSVFEQTRSVPAAASLAMAHAAAEDFAKALEVQQWAVQHAAEQGFAQQLPWLEGNRQLYRSKKPCRKPWSKAQGYPPIAASPAPEN